MSDAAESIEIKKRARRRLVGAIALALLAAVILPMMMEQEPHPGNADIQISIPARSGPPAAAPELPPVEPAAAPAEAVSEPAANQADGIAPPPGAPSSPAVAEDKSSSAAAKNDVEKEKVMPEPGPAAADPVEEMRARAAIEGRELPRGETFVLQIGAFADAGKAADMVKDLKAKGFPAYAESAGKVTRVRVGPLVGRNAAQETAGELAELGFSTVRMSR